MFDFRVMFQNVIDDRQAVSVPGSLGGVPAAGKLREGQIVVPVSVGKEKADPVFLQEKRKFQLLFPGFPGSLDGVVKVNPQDADKIDHFHTDGKDLEPDGGFYRNPGGLGGESFADAETFDLRDLEGFEGKFRGITLHLFI